MKQNVQDQIQFINTHWIASFSVDFWYFGWRRKQKSNNNNPCGKK